MTTRRPDPSRPTGKLRLRAWLGLRDGVDAAFAAIVDYARAQAAAAATAPETAVHEYRKSIRRARSLVRLGVPFLAGGAVESLSDALRDALALASDLRDADVLLATLRGLPADEVAPEARARALDRLAADVAETKAGGAAGPALTAGAAALAPLAEQFSLSLPATLRPERLEVGLARLFRRSRRAYRTARRRFDDDAIHAWRKRVKELRYALELIDGVRPGTRGAAHRYAARLAERLGEITDLIVLRRWLDASIEILPAEAAALSDAIERDVKARFRRLCPAADALFDRRARDFAREVVHPPRAPLERTADS